MSCTHPPTHPPIHRPHITYLPTRLPSIHPAAGDPDGGVQWRDQGVREHRPAGLALGLYESTGLPGWH